MISDQSIIGETYTTEDKDKIYASTFSYASIPNGIDVYDEYTAPQLVNKLMEETPIPPKGPLEAVDENPTVSEYYDGSLNLNKVKVNCLIYTSSSDCTHQSGCGWCGSKNGCIFGTKFGPLQPCIQSSYISGVRYPNSGAILKTVNEAVGLVSATIVSDIK